MDSMVHSVEDRSDLMNIGDKFQLTRMVTASIAQYSITKADLGLRFELSKAAQNLARFNVRINATEYLEHFFSVSHNTRTLQRILRAFLNTEHYNIGFMITGCCNRFTGWTY